MWKYFNKNPLGIDTEDCVLRCISTAEGTSWEECQKKLSYLSGKEGKILNDAEFVENYLNKRYPKKCYHGITIGEFADFCPKGNFIVTTNGHIVAIINNVILDTWDCSNRIIKCCWQVK